MLCPTEKLRPESELGTNNEGRSKGEQDVLVDLIAMDKNANRKAELAWRGV